MVKDWRGTPIEVGALVVYPSRTGSSMWITEGQVVSVKESMGVTRDFSVGVRRIRSSSSTQKRKYLKRERVAYPDPSRITVIE